MTAEGRALVEKFNRAMVALVAGKGTLKQRVSEYHQIMGQTLPGGRSQLDEIAGSEGSPRFVDWSDEEVARWAEAIVQTHARAMLNLGGELKG